MSVTRCFGPPFMPGTAQVPVLVSQCCGERRKLSLGWAEHEGVLTAARQPLTMLRPAQHRPHPVPLPVPVPVPLPPTLSAWTHLLEELRQHPHIFQVDVKQLLEAGPLHLDHHLLALELRGREGKGQRA